ncbi:hypothetical protein [Paractinoplanes durhamensis]|uniref:SH3 domain-containing protein n=1 Tax=Paractinoplanes durhamensis TaxID=113563 RepID=A0ABQ3Z763_9ACTN|nr:hypothetical protein [Actinoplanes durhamensis]GIE05644.1 hypothetical protein Adu01nite_69940 [Actinoplanes durhamensis]
MRSLLRTVAGTATLGALVTGLGVVATAGPAAASVDECTNGRNGFVSIPYNQAGNTQSYIHLGSALQTLVSLERRTINGQDRVFAKIQPRQNGSGYTRPGNQVWLDWSTTGGNGWLQCGPFSVSANNAPNTSAAQRTNSSSSWVFRACGLVDGIGGCTSWWHQ